MERLRDLSRSLSTVQCDNGRIVVKDFCFSDNISGKTIYKIAKSNRKHEHQAAKCWKMKQFRPLLILLNLYVSFMRLQFRQVCRLGVKLIKIEFFICPARLFRQQRQCNVSLIIFSSLFDLHSEKIWLLRNINYLK